MSRLQPAVPSDTARRSRRRLYKRLGIIGAILTAVLIGAGLLATRAYHRPLPSLRPVTASVKSPLANIIPTPNVMWSPYGQQYVALEGTSLQANNGVGGSFPAASTAKVMMALLILQKRPLKLGEQGPNIPVTAAIVSQYQQELAANESVVGVTAGEQLTEYQALEAMLIPSATNVADLLASWEFGSVSNYTVAANQMAASLGMPSTHFGDASGFASSTVSSAADLVKLGQAALQDPVFAQIVAKPSVELPVAGTVSNFNTVLGQAGINGIKTGNTDQAGGVFLFAAPYLGHTVVGATMNAPDLGTALHDAPEIIQSFESNLQTDIPVKAGQIVARYTLPWGGSVNAVAQKQLSTIDWKGSHLATHTTINPIRPSQANQSTVGSLSFTTNDGRQATPIVLAGSIPQPSFWWRLLHNH